MFGRVAEASSDRGEFFLFYSYAATSGGPLLIALVAGEAAERFETLQPEAAVASVMHVLRGIFEPQGVSVPDPVQVCSWREVGRCFLMPGAKLSRQSRMYEPMSRALPVRPQHSCSKSASADLMPDGCTGARVLFSVAC
jgi:Flavin containing amine oxidoreductase